MKTRLVTVKVTEQHIATGFKNHCYRCPVALALLDVLDSSYSTAVYHGYVAFRYGHQAFRQGPDREYMSSLPSRVIRFIGEFDSNLTIKSVPFSFELAIPEHMVRAEFLA